jgi:hypothetical protein
MPRLFVSIDNIIQYVYTKQRDETDSGKWNNHHEAAVIVLGIGRYVKPFL